jgi:trigger factor
VGFRAASMVKVSVETLPSSEAVLNVDFSWEELEKASDQAYRKLVQKADIKGFRRGKAPRSLLERQLGKEYIYQEGLDDLMTATYRDALKEHNIVPLTQPELEAPVLEMGQPYHFSLKVPVLPTVTLGDYRSLHFDRSEATVTSEEVEKEIERLRNRQESWNEVERPAQLKDRVTMDLKLEAEEQTVSDLKDNPFELTDERHGLFSGMDEQIVGMQVGESKAFTTTIPEDYANEKLAGKTASYEVALKKVEEKVIPELDDAFAIQASEEEYQTLEDMRKGISDRLLADKKRKVRDELREQVLKAIVEQAELTIHPVLIEEEAHEMVHQMGHMLEQQHMSLEQYLLLTKQTEAEYMETLKPDAERRVRQQLVLDEVIKQEAITVSPEEVETLYRFYAQMGQRLPQTQEQIRSIASSLQREKAISRLLELTTDPDPDEASDESEAEAEPSEETTDDSSTAIVEAELVTEQTAETVVESTTEEPAR